MTERQTEDKEVVRELIQRTNLGDTVELVLIDGYHVIRGTGDTALEVLKKEEIPQHRIHESRPVRKLNSGIKQNGKQKQS